MTKFLKILLIVFLSILIIIGALISAYFIITKDAVLDERSEERRVGKSVVPCVFMGGGGVS